MKKNTFYLFITLGLSLFCNAQVLIQRDMEDGLTTGFQPSGGTVVNATATGAGNTTKVIKGTHTSTSDFYVRFGNMGVGTGEVYDVTFDVSSSIAIFSVNLRTTTSDASSPTTTVQPTSITLPGGWTEDGVVKGKITCVINTFGTVTATFVVPTITNGNNNSRIQLYQFQAATGNTLEIDNITVTKRQATWNGSAWSTTTGPTIDAFIDASYSTTTNNPFNAKILTVNSSGSLTINSGTNVTVATQVINNSSLGAAGVVVESGANLIQTATPSTNTGAITVNRASAPLYRSDYTLWSSPTGTTQALNGFSPLTTTGRFYEYNSGTNLYSVVPDNTLFSQGKGFLIRMPNSWVDYIDITSVPASWTGSFTGIPNSGTINITTVAGYNAIGNPYPSSIDANAFINANLIVTGTTNKSIDGSLYFWRKKNGAAIVTSAYATYTLAGGVANDGGITPTQNIQVGQGFFVNNTSSPLVAPVSFLNTMRGPLPNSAGTGTGTNWTGSSFASPGYTHTAGSILPLTGTFVPTAGKSYQIAFTVTPAVTTPAGTFTIALGGFTSGAIPGNAALNASFTVTATTASPLVITPVTTFNGSIIVSSIKETSASTSAPFLRTQAVAQSSRVWLNLSAGTVMVNQMMVAYMNGATQGVDNGIDGKYINDSATALTSYIAGGEYVIQGRPTFDPADVVALTFKTTAAGDYTIAIDHTDGLFATGQDVYLVDSKTGAETNLKSDAYTFTAAAGVDNTRFSLKYQKTLGVNAAAFNDNSVMVYRNNGTLTVNSGANAISNIKVFDIQGRLLVEQKEVNAASATIKNLKATQQVLLVKVTGADNSVVTKKVIN